MHQLESDEALEELEREYLGRAGGRKGKKEILCIHVTTTV